MVTGVKNKGKSVSIRNVYKKFFYQNMAKKRFYFSGSSRWFNTVESYFWQVACHSLILRISSSNISSTIVMLPGQQEFTAQNLFRAFFKEPSINKKNVLLRIKLPSSRKRSAVLFVWVYMLLSVREQLVYEIGMGQVLKN